MGIVEFVIDISVEVRVDVSVLKEVVTTLVVMVVDETPLGRLRALTPPMIAAATKMPNTAIMISFPVTFIEDYISILKPIIQL